MIGASGENLVFLLSMPRAGSTLLGMMLGSHGQVHCPPEPWLQLVLAELSGNRDVSSYPVDVYNATIAVGAFLRSLSADAEVCDCLASHLLEHGVFGVARKGASDDFAIIAYNAALSAWRKRLFVDKTPRYYHILDFLEARYPGAKYIVLWRNPLDIALSYKTTWNVSLDELDGRVVTANSVDFAKGLFELYRFASSASRNVEVVRYEDLVTQPATTLRRLCGFLGFEYSEAMQSFFGDNSLRAAQSRSSVGDRKILWSSGQVSATSVGGWRQMLPRDEIARLIAILGTRLFRAMGYGDVADYVDENGIDVPLEEVAAERRTAILSAATRPEVEWPSLGRLAYLLASLGKCSDPAGVARSYSLGQLSPRQHAALEEALFDLARRYADAERDRTDSREAIEELTLAVRRADAESATHSKAIAELTVALGKAGAEGVAHRDAIDKLTGALRQADIESTAHREAIGQLTTALQRCDAERASGAQAISELSEALRACRRERDGLLAVLRRMPIRVAMRLFRIAA